MSHEHTETLRCHNGQTQRQRQLKIDCLDSLTKVEARHWNQLCGCENPFLRYEFLAGLETSGCLSEHGWQPCHIVIRDGHSLLAAMPLYLKQDSIGEFVFDHDWAHAYYQTGQHYYPKAVSAIPFTPVSGRRMLYHPDILYEPMEDILLETCCELITDNQFSSLHLLFAEQPDEKALLRHELLPRTGCQYHWFNDGYADFEDFLSRLRADKRKKIRAERKQAQQSGIRFQMFRGGELSEQQWQCYYEFYASTFMRKWGEPRFNLDFLHHLGDTMPEQVLLFMALRDETPIAGALALCSEDTLYGRHWGCREYIPALHFELCYYQTLEYCIDHGLRCMNAGAQGEHKIKRGFMPVLTQSWHWIADARFRLLIRDYLRRETELVLQYRKQLRSNHAYKRD